MVNKIGLIRIIEVVIAILIILGVLAAVSFNKPRGSGEDLGELIVPLLEEISKNNTMRTEIIDKGKDYESVIYEFIDDKIPEHLNKSVKICDAGDLCFIDPYPAGDVYSRERIISSSAEGVGSPKKVKIFLWRLS